MIFGHNISTDNYHRNYKELLFCEEKHRKLQHEECWHSFYLIREKDHEIVAESHFHIVEKKANNPLLAPYGGISFHPSLSGKWVDEFVSKLVETLIKLGVEEINLKTFPTVYNPEVAGKQQYALAQTGFKMVKVDPHWVLSLTETTFEDQLVSSEYKRRLRKLEREEFVFKNDMNPELIFDFIVQCRNERDYRFSMTKSTFTKYQQHIPGQMHTFGVLKEGKLTAAALCFRVNDEIMYDFSHAHLRSFDSYSPVLLLMSGMYEFGLKNGVKLIDLGSSSLNNLPNYPLISFKESVGAIISPKYYWQKTINH